MGPAFRGEHGGFKHFQASALPQRPYRFYGLGMAEGVVSPSIVHGTWPCAITRKIILPREKMSKATLE